MLNLYREGDEVLDYDYDEFMEMFWGKGDEKSFMLDLLTLARVALVHLQGSSFLLNEPLAPKKEKRKRVHHRPDKSIVRLPRDNQGAGSEAADDDDSQLHALAEGEIPAERDHT